MMTTTYELYTNENGTPKAVEGKAPAIIERVENLETSVETAQATAEACLPLAGGTMTGALTLAYDAPRLNLKNSRISKGVTPTSTQYTDIEFLNANGGRFATITSSMTSNGSGLFSFWHANASGAQSSALQVGVDANGNDVFTYGGKVVERVNSSGTNWIRYESGIQIVHGNVTVASGTLGGVFTFPVAFSTIEGMCFATTYTGSSVAVSNVVARSTTKITVNVSSLAGKYDWARSSTVFVIGRWK